MSRLPRLAMIGVLCLVACTPVRQTPTETDAIDYPTLLDKVEGGWVGQMAGVQWGAHTEFRYLSKIIPNEVPWSPDSINGAYNNDDLYVEIPFMETMREHGVNVGWVEFGESFLNTEFELWHANWQGRTLLELGFQTPESGHYRLNPHADDIDWQIEADFAGIIAPGQPGAAIDIAWRAGHVMNYGDGVYGGVAVAAMHAAAYFADSVDEIIEAGRQAVPEGSKYRQVIEDVIAWHAEHPTDWKKTWQLIQDKWGEDDRCPDGKARAFNIDAKINGAYVFLGLLYGDGDFEESMRIAMLSGQDSDCNPSTVGGILGAWLGLSGIPDKFKSRLVTDHVFSYTDIDYADAIELSVDLAREALVMNGGSVTGSGEDEVWQIPTQETIVPPILEQWPEEENPLPELTLTLERTQGRTVTLSAEATDDDGIQGYQWYFGDLSYENGPEVKHTYRQDGTYEVIGYVTDGIGNTAWSAVEVHIGD